MPVCHKCPHNRELERLRKICGACPGASSNFGGQVHTDAFEDEDLAAKKLQVDSVAMYNSRLGFASRVAGMDCETAEILKRVLAEFATLTDEEAPIVVRRLRGETDTQIVRATGLSKQTVWLRWHKLKRKNPLWAALDNGNIGLRGGGRKAADLKADDDETPPPELSQEVFI